MAEKIGGTQAVIALAAVGACAWFFFGGGLEHQAAKDLAKIEVQVANDSVAQYEIAKRSGTPIDRCVHAGMVSAAYIQAKDEPSYVKWKAVEKTDCAAAGLPGQ